MTDRPLELLDAFPSRRLLVVGDVMLDGYVEGVCRRVCPDVPAPVVDLCEARSAPGGAANAAANARALGAEVMLVGVVGDDEEAEELAAYLADRHTPATLLVRAAERRTLAKRRIVASGQLICRLDQGDTSPVSEPVESELIQRLTRCWMDADAVLISDYNYGTLTPGVIAALAALQRTEPRTILADSKRLPDLRSIGLTAAKPNYREALRLLGLDSVAGDRATGLSRHASQILEATGARVVAATLDLSGAVVFERGRPPYRTLAEPQPQCTASGAGDTYSATLALALVCGADVPAAADLAAAAAAVVVAKPGTSVCTAGELRNRLAGGVKVADFAGIAAHLDAKRTHGCRIVLTNGCFDILHSGHVNYLHRAKALGDILVVGVNTDAGIRRLKGASRPINTLADRLRVLAALGCVDRVVPFDEDTPHQLIRAVRPHVFVKGGDYTRDRLPEAGLVEELGGEVRILPFVAARSTTGLIERIRATTAAEGAPSRVTGGGR